MRDRHAAPRRTAPRGIDLWSSAALEMVQLKRRSHRRQCAEIDLPAQFGSGDYMNSPSADSGVATPELYLQQLGLILHGPYTLYTAGVCISRYRGLEHEPKFRGMWPIV